MEHCIWLTSLDDKTLYLPGHMILIFTRMDNNETFIQMCNGSTLLVKTPAQVVEQRYNKYCNDLFEFNSKLKNND